MVVSDFLWSIFCSIFTHIHIYIVMQILMKLAMYACFCGLNGVDREQQEITPP